MNGIIRDCLSVAGRTSRDLGTDSARALQNGAEQDHCSKADGFPYFMPAGHVAPTHLAVPE